MLKKRLFVGLIALVLLGTSAIAFAYWDNLSTTQNPTVTIGEGTSVTVSVNANGATGKTLVPSGAALAANDVTTLDIVYDVVLTKTLASDLTLSVVADNVTIGGSSTYAGLVNISVSPASTSINSSTVQVTVTVTLTEPADQTAYEAIVNQDIAFDLTFTAE